MRRMRPRIPGKVPYACARRARTELEHQFDFDLVIEHLFDEHMFGEHQFDLTT
jgi:hypothetical protein